MTAIALTFIVAGNALFACNRPDCNNLHVRIACNNPDCEFRTETPDLACDSPSCGNGSQLACNLPSCEFLPESIDLACDKPGCEVLPVAVVG